MKMTVTTYPLKFEEDYLQVIREYAVVHKITTKTFLLEAIDEAVNRKILKKEEI